MKRLALISLIVSLLLVAACTAESEPPVAGETTTAAATTEPTPAIEPTPTTETVPTLEPTATVVEEVEETAVPTETAVAEDSKSLFNDLPVQGEQPAPVGLLYSPVEGGIWQIGTDGQPQQLTAQQDAIPSPDGRHAIYNANDNLWLIDLASDERTQLTSTANGQYLAIGPPQWADNETILVGIWLDLETEGGPNWGRPALIDIVSGELTLIDAPFQLLMRSIPAASGTGDVAFDTVGRSADDRDFNWIYQPGTGTMTFEAGDFINAIENAGYISPAWSVDGRFLIWLAFTGNNVNHLAVFDLESGSVANLPSYQGVGFGGPYPNPVISPDPIWIALRQLTPDPNLQGLWLYTQDGQAPLFIAHNGGESLWVNDHLLLFIDYDENFNGQLQQYDALTGVRSVVTLPDVVQIFGIVE